MNKSIIPDETFVNCPTCNDLVIWNEINAYRPFCSKRGQLIDLGEWTNEEKLIPSQSEVSDNEEWREESYHKKDR